MVDFSPLLQEALSAALVFRLRMVDQNLDHLLPLTNLIKAKCPILRSADIFFLNFQMHVIFKTFAKFKSRNVFPTARKPFWKILDFDGDLPISLNVGLLFLCQTNKTLQNSKNSTKSPSKSLKISINHCSLVEKYFTVSTMKPRLRKEVWSEFAKRENWPRMERRAQTSLDPETREPRLRRYSCSTWGRLYYLPLKNIMEKKEQWWWGGNNPNKIFVNDC